jgi:hypothetical protein
MSYKFKGNNLVKREMLIVDKGAGNDEHVRIPKNGDI